MAPDFGIVVTLPFEFDAVKELLETYEVRHARINQNLTSPFLQGTIADFQVVVAQCAQRGSICSALAATDLVREFQPRYLVLLGIAGGVPGEVALGDVVIADPVIGYEYSKVYKDFSENEPRPFRSPQKLVPSFQNDMPRLPCVSGKPVDGPTEIQVGPLASGSKLVAAKEFRDKLTGLSRKVCALEMEAEGVAQAARHYGCEFLVVKAISDFADSTKHPRETLEETKLHDAWQSYAARASAKAFKQLLLSQASRSCLIRWMLPFRTKPLGT